MSKTPPRKEPTEYELARAIWYQKLKAGGFNDIEADEHNLKEWTLTRAAQGDSALWEAKAAYYHMADKFLHEFAFPDDMAKTIWQYHVEGMGVRQIASLLAAAGVKKQRKSLIHNRVKHLAHIMKTMYLVGYREQHE